MRVETDMQVIEEVVIKEVEVEEFVFTRREAEILFASLAMASVNNLNQKFSYHGFKHIDTKVLDESIALFQDMKAVLKD